MPFNELLFVTFWKRIPIFFYLLTNCQRRHLKYIFIVLYKFCQLLYKQIRLPSNSYLTGIWLIKIQNILDSDFWGWVYKCPYHLKPGLESVDFKWVVQQIPKIATTVAWFSSTHLRTGLKVWISFQISNGIGFVKYFV